MPWLPPYQWPTRIRPTPSNREADITTIIPCRPRRLRIIITTRIPTPRDRDRDSSSSRCVPPPRIGTRSDALPAIRPVTGVAATGEGSAAVAVKSCPTTTATTLRRTLSRNGLPALPAGMATTSPARHRSLPFCDLVHCSMLTTAILMVYIGKEK